MKKGAFFNIFSVILAVSLLFNCTAAAFAYDDPSAAEAADPSAGSSDAEAAASPAGSSDAEASDSSADISETTTDSDAAAETTAAVRASTVITREDGQMSISRRTRNHLTPMGSDDWTILIYMCGSDLESNEGCATRDIKEMMAATFGDNINIVIETGGAKKWSSDVVSTKNIGRYTVENHNLKLLEELPAANMADPETLSDFISWGVKNYGAAHMGLIFWDHGGGSISGVCFDEKNFNDSLSLKKIDAALTAVYDQMTDDFEFIGFDACLMGTLETASTLVPYARYMYASEEREPGTGWDYTRILNYLAGHPNANGRELGIYQADSYFASASAHYNGALTFSIIDLDELDNFILLFDDVAREIYNSENFTEISRSGQKTDSFGSNSRAEGYTNMIDLAQLIQAVREYAPSADDALTALGNTVIYTQNSGQHKNAGGLAAYYPLSVRGAAELSTFREVCPSAYYLAFVDKVAYGSTGGDVETYDNSYLFADTENTMNITYLPDETITIIDEDIVTSPECPLNITGIYINEEGSLEIDFGDMDAFAFATCMLYYRYYLNEEHTEWMDAYMGEDDDVFIDEENLLVEDDFYASWVTLNGYPLPLDIIAQYDDISLYTCRINLNGDRTNLHLSYDWQTDSFSVLGTWDDVDTETGMVARADTTPLEDGDRIELIYEYIDQDGNNYESVANTITVDGELKVTYSRLPAGSYLYGFCFYDIYGGWWVTDCVKYIVTEDNTFYIDLTGEN